MLFAQLAVTPGNYLNAKEKKLNFKGFNSKPDVKLITRATPEGEARVELSY